MKKNSLFAFVLASGFLLSNAAQSQDISGASLSVGAIKDSFEATAVRVLIEQADAWNAEDKLFMAKQQKPGPETFYTMSRKFLIDATDKGTLGGVVLRYGFRVYNVTNEVDRTLPPRSDGTPAVTVDSTDWIHLFPVELGFDSDRSFKNQDVLLEVGYVPLHLNAGNCFKLGANPIAGVAVQYGHRTRDPNTLVPAGQVVETSGTLFRAKAEAKLVMPLSCVLNASGQPSTADSASALSVLGTDISNWRLLASATGWRDFVENHTYKIYEVVLEIPTGAKTFLDIKREYGARPTTFDTGAKMSASLTVNF